MIPRDEFSTIVAGSVTAEEFVLMDGSEVVGKLNPTPATLPPPAVDGSAIEMIHEPANVSRLVWTKPVSASGVTNVALEVPTGSFAAPAASGSGVQFQRAQALIGSRNALGNMRARSRIGGDANDSEASATVNVVESTATANARISATRDGVGTAYVDANGSTGAVTIRARGVTTQISPLFIAAGTFVGTTDPVGGLLDIPYGVTFSSAPIVVAINGDRAAASFVAQIWSRAATQFTVATGLPGVLVRVDWIAAGLVP